MICSGAAVLSHEHSVLFAALHILLVAEQLTH